MTQPLSARAEAGEDATVLLDELWQLCRGNTYVGDSKQRIMLTNFLALMQVNTPEAHLAAAMMLVPEGWRLAALCERDPWFVRLETTDFESITWGKGGDWITTITSGHEVKATGPAPAHALIAAITKTQETDNGSE